MRLRLVNNGFSYDDIVNGRKQVGRVYQHADTKQWHAFVRTSKGREECIAPSKRQAFDQVCAQAFGFSNVNALEQHNSETRFGNRAKRAKAQHIASEMLRGNFEPFGDMLDAQLKKK
mgnify:CR=1 FL=1